MIFMVYSKKVMQCFKKPKNMGKMKNPDAVGKVGNIVCGDVMWIYIKVKNNRIKDIKFQTLGCVAAIATSSMVTEIAKGKTLREALKINKTSILKKLGGLPSIKIHCSMLATDALHEAIYNYLNTNKLKIPKELEKNHERILKTLNKIGH